MANYSVAIRHSVASLLVIGLVSAANAESSDTAADVVAVGPVELVEPGAVTVLGRSYHVDDSGGLEAGDKVAIHGSLLPDGSVAYAWAETLGSYVAGSDRVFETGIVTNVDESSGRLSIGDSEIDYTAALSEQGATVPNKGDMVAVAGIQPEIGGVVLGATTRNGTAAVAMAVPGVATAGIHGSNARTAGITGSNAGAAGITGSNVGTRGITGSNVGTAGITGSNVGAAGITGSNVGTAGITGSNVGAAGITGSNVGTAGITGSNVGAAGITGSNVGTAGITGSNVGAAGITGSNVGSAGITGSNVGTAGITGSNVGTAGITGSNVGTAGITGSNVGTR
jgi:SCY1-like protein 2